MSDDTDLTQRPGWKAVERWLSENEPPAAKPTMQEPIAKWGTRGLLAGCAVGFVLAFTAAGQPENLLPALPIFTGLFGIPCAVAGMLIGLAVWIFRRK
jgi:hypothetical protein